MKKNSNEINNRKVKMYIYNKLNKKVISTEKK